MKYVIDNDFHCHSFLSNCCSDERMTPETILRHAEKFGYAVQCITDHFWDEEHLPGAPGWYAEQCVRHVKKNLPLPQSDKVRFVFGCETEYSLDSQLGIHPDSYDEFSFIVIPPNHFHMDFVRKPEYDTEQKVANLMVTRLEELAAMDLPFHKIGIAHMNCSLIAPFGNQFLTYDLICEDRFRAVMHTLAQKGAGIELNADCFLEAPRAELPRALRIFKMAREEGCKFYCASDAHTVDRLGNVLQLGEVVDALGLTEDDKYHIPV